MSSPISQATLDTIKATRGLVAANVPKIVEVFYPKMLSRHPELFEFFNKQNQTSGRQQSALAEAVIAYASNIEHLERLGGAVERIAHKHCALNISPDQYAIVRDNLLESVVDVLGKDVVTAPVANAWTEAVNALAGILISREKELYDSAANCPGGWRGKREFTIEEIIPEAEDIISIKLVASDGKPLMKFQRGQALNIASNPGKEDVAAPRHYTIISDPNDSSHYTIAPKILRASDGVPDHDGMMSSWLHARQVGDKIEAFPPFGATSEMSAADTSCSVFISSGIGITPVISSLPLASALGIPVALFHADHSSKTHAFARLVREMAPKDSISHVFYGHPEDEDAKIPGFVPGRMAGPAILERLTGIDIAKANYYISTNDKLLLLLAKQLKEGGVPHDRIKPMLFGPHVPM